jgi:hypothetical protein
MKIHDIVTELFQPGKDWKWSFQGSEEAVAVFQVGDVPYMFHAYGTDGEWEAEFKRHGSKLDRIQKFGLTGTGNSAEVMSTVVDIMRAFLDKYKDKIQVLTFSAKEDSRQGLYARMVKRLMPDWTMQQKDEFFTLFAPKQHELDESVGSDYKEIEFICVNPQFPQATDPELQKQMFVNLKKIPGVIPLWQEWGDYSEGQISLSAIYKDKAARSKILSLAKQLGVEIDLEQPVNDSYVDRAIRGEHEGQITENQITKSKR